MKNNIKLYRAKRNITQAKLAEDVSVTRQTVISLEREKYEPSLKLAYRISSYFGVRIEEMFVLEELDEEE
ncbi:helix-turn-helix transcriptional regulator [Pontibacillus yanchengensis]|uniref:XRE family transcriptional regulator n=1 Tax=Pontibacillus yanchengensis Y32 TaxID=1385514 RepID=A0A0A2TKC1_9BACI|nr:XRE family transcriptional regulator [Pontibacillus yanchengensis Y32]